MRRRAWSRLRVRDRIACDKEALIPRRPQYRKPNRRRPGEAPPTHRVYLSPEAPFPEDRTPEGKTWFRLRFDSEPSPEWMRAYRAGLLGMMREDRDAVLRFEFQGDSVRVAATDTEIGKLRRVFERRVESVNSILSGGRGVVAT